MNMPSASYKRYRFPPQIIAHSVWLYFRFPLSLRLIEELLLERGIVVSYETIRRGVLFGLSVRFRAVLVLTLEGCDRNVCLNSAAGASSG
jgi:hypothetical protein